MARFAHDLAVTETCVCALVFFADMATIGIRAGCRGKSYRMPPDPPWDAAESRVPQLPMRDPAACHAFPGGISRDVAGSHGNFRANYSGNPPLEPMRSRGMP